MKLVVTIEVEIEEKKDTPNWKSYMSQEINAAITAVEGVKDFRGITFQEVKEYE